MRASVGLASFFLRAFFCRLGVTLLLRFHRADGCDRAVYDSGDFGVSRSRDGRKPYYLLLLVVLDFLDGNVPEDQREAGQSMIFLFLLFQDENPIGKGSS